MANVANVYAAMPSVTGALRRAPLGTPAPTGTGVLDEAFIDMGFIGEDGFTESNTRDTDKKKAFGGTTVKILQTDYASTVSFTFLESLNANVLRAVFGDENVTVADDEIQVRKNKRQLPHSSWVIDTVDGDAVRRNYIPDGQIIEVDDIQIVHSDTIMYTVTVEAYENEDGDNILEWIRKGDGTEIEVEPGDG